MPTLTLTATAAADLRAALLADRETTLRGLYRQAYPMVERLVLRQGGSGQDAQDIFQDALLILYEKAVAGTLELTAAPSTYLLAVSRNRWRQEQERRRQHPTTSLTIDQHDTLPADDAAATEVMPSVLAYLTQLGERCRSILLSFYYHRQPLEQIAAAHHYRSVRSATVQKFKCLERLRGAVRAGSVELIAAQTA